MLSRYASRLVAVAIVFVLALAFIPTPGQAVDIPSSASGDAYAAGYDCRFNFSIASNAQHGFELRCTLPNSAQSAAVATGPGCPTDWWMVPFNEWGGTGVHKQASQLTYVAPDGSEVTTWVMGFGEKTESTKWLRVTGFNSSTVETRIGLFSELIQPGGAGGIPYTFQRSQPFYPVTPYAGCGGAIAASPVIGSTRLGAADRCARFGRDCRP